MTVLAPARRAVARLVLGDTEGDGEDLARAWDVAERAGLTLAQAQLISLQAARALLHGDFEVAVELIDRSRALTQQTQLYAQARQDLVMPYPQQWDAPSITCWQVVVAASLAGSVGLDPAVPAAIADRLLPFADHLAVHGGIGALGPVAVYLGLAKGRLALASLHAGRGEWAAAAAEAAAAREVAEEIGMRLVALEAARLAHE
ncbi:hypothetical protein ACI797_24225 [Geodermatophilus sp. SYSU D00691]